jgi:hypothetical protein
MEEADPRRDPSSGTPQRAVGYRLLRTEVQLGAVGGEGQQLVHLPVFTQSADAR